MRDLREILRQKLQLGCSHRKTADAVGFSAGSVASAAIRAKALGLDWEAVEKLDDERLETRMYGPRGGRRDGRPEPNLPYLHVELRRTGVTLQLLHLEYLEQHPNGYRYTAFCQRYSEYKHRRVVAFGSRAERSFGPRDWLRHRWSISCSGRLPWPSPDC